MKLIIKKLCVQQPPPLPTPQPEKKKKTMYCPSPHICTYTTCTTKLKRVLLSVSCDYKKYTIVEKPISSDPFTTCKTQGTIKIMLCKDDHFSFKKIQIPEEKCISVPRQKCWTEPRQKCWKEPREECGYVLVKVNTT